MSVFTLAVGESGEVAAINVDGAAGERLAALGLCKGATVTCLGFSFFRGSVLLAVGGNRVAMRKSVAQKIQIVYARTGGENS